MAREYGYGTRAGKRSLGAAADGWIVSRRVWMDQITSPPRHLVERASIQLGLTSIQQRKLMFGSRHVALEAKVSSDVIPGVSDVRSIG